MSARNLLDSLKTWIVLDSKALKHNYGVFRKLIGPRTGLLAVVKSNAYGHGISSFSKMVNRLGIDGFCVDSVAEGVRLRTDGIIKPILVLGPTLNSLNYEAVKNGITLSVSNLRSLKEIMNLKVAPYFHIKFDTGMHRQGFFEKDVSRIIGLLKSRGGRLESKLTGIYTHFAAAKDIYYPTYTERQFKIFMKIRRMFEKSGFSVVYHAAATGGALIDSRYRLDAVRIGIGLYGLYPSKEIETQFPKLNLKPVLRWLTVVSDVKRIKKGNYVGYDLSERLVRDSKIAILPIGYWHGLPRSLSGIGEVLINGRRARILGRVSMDLTVVDVTGIKLAVGDRVTIIGDDSRNLINASRIASQSGTTHYELLTRLNPLIKKIIN
jgi:alanine racemase